MSMEKHFICISCGTIYGRKDSPCERKYIHGVKTPDEFKVIEKFYNTCPKCFNEIFVECSTHRNEYIPKKYALKYQGNYYGDTYCIKANIDAIVE